MVPTQREKAAKIMKSLTGPRVDKALGRPYLSARARQGGWRDDAAAAPARFEVSPSASDGKGLSPQAIPGMRR
jgi:hypothetical protein